MIFEKGTRFTSLIDINETDGEVTYSDSAMHVSNTSEAIILVRILALMDMIKTLSPTV
ncbi:MAG: hypothetical protein ACI97P_002473 [Arcticibacterium sp.]|jgi:hypothetical protein